MCLCCITLNAQECDSLFHSNDSTFCVNTSKTNNTSKKSLSKKKNQEGTKILNILKNTLIQIQKNKTLGKTFIIINSLNTELTGKTKVNLIGQNS